MRGFPEPEHDTVKTRTHLPLVALVGELHADVVFFADLRDHGSFTADDFGVVFGVDREGHLVAP